MRLRVGGIVDKVRGASFSFSASGDLNGGGIELSDSASGRFELIGLGLPSSSTG